MPWISRINSCPGNLSHKPNTTQEVALHPPPRAPLARVRQSSVTIARCFFSSALVNKNTVRAPNQHDEGLASSSTVYFEAHPHHLPGHREHVQFIN